MNLIYSISHWIYGKEPLDQQFQRIKKYGYDGVEIRINELKDFNLDLIKKYLKAFSLPCTSICPNMMFASDKSKCRNIIDKDEKIRKNSMLYLKKCIEIGIELHAKLVLIVPSGVFNMRDHWIKENIEVCTRALQELGDYTQSLGTILLALEPLNRYENMFLRNCYQAKMLVNEIHHPRVKMMLDMFHSNIEEDNCAEAIYSANKDLIHCHVADSNRKSPGRGQINWFEIFRALRDIEYDGAIVGEFLPPHAESFYIDQHNILPEAEIYTRECIEFLKIVEKIIKK
ncbi:MAG: sugar phosphate isomerase/epimerase family protein [Promethearchaeota archaeon]